MVLPPIPGASSYTVTYNSESHWSVLTQLHGSHWPRLLPYCIFNLALMVLLEINHSRNQAEGKKFLEMSRVGHSFITLVVAFLLVSRVNTALKRYNVVRDSLGVMYREARELIQNVCVYTGDDHTPSAIEWRHEVAYRCLILLKCTMVVMDYPTDHVTPWEIPELNGVELDDVKNNIFLSANNQRWAHGERTVWDETMRVPIRLAYLLRKSINKQSNMLQTPLGRPFGKLMGSVDTFMNGYYSVRNFLTTPVPFPLIQMGRTFLFLYVFTVPFVMVSDDESSTAAHCFSVFLLTYGFIGLESVAIELDNPFGNDANDFNNSALAMTAYEDTYLTILDVDGRDATDKLRARMYDGNDENLSTDQTWLLSEDSVGNNFNAVT